MHSTLTRAFDLTGLERATLHFQTWHDIEPYLDSGYVSVSTDGGQTWNFLNGARTIYDPDFDYGPNYTGVSGQRARPEWVPERMDLTDYLGSEVLLRFEYVTQAPYNGHGWAVDDIAIPELDYLYDVDSADGGAGGCDGSVLKLTTGRISEFYYRPARNQLAANAMVRERTSQTMRGAATVRAARLRTTHLHAIAHCVINESLAVIAQRTATGFSLWLSQYEVVKRNPAAPRPIRGTYQAHVSIPKRRICDLG